jgi:hypothetical protein
MPALSLVVCVYRQRDLLERLLRKTAGCYDDLVVVHDGPDMDRVRIFVEQCGGRFFERARAWQQEPHWPFAWTQAKHEWILRLDADEFPGEEMKTWLKEFRRAPEPADDISGFTCIWPLWDGRKIISEKWPAGRNFLFHKQRVRFFGMNEQTPIHDGRSEARGFILHHQPKRQSLGLCNVLLRKQAYHWRATLAQSLLGKPTDLPCWRWENENWPTDWECIRRHPWRTGFSRLTIGTIRGLRDQWRNEKRIFPRAAINGPIHHFLICFEYWRQHRQQKREPNGHA